MATKNKILSFDALKRYTQESGAEPHRTIMRFMARASAKEHTPTLWERMWPKAEVLRLRAFVEAMRAEEHVAARNVLDLYSENEYLRGFKALHDGEMHRFVGVDEYNKAKNDAKAWRDKFDGVSRALNRQHDDWMGYVKNQPAPTPKAK